MTRFRLKSHTPLWAVPAFCLLSMPAFQTVAQAQTSEPDTSAESVTLQNPGPNATDRASGLMARVPKTEPDAAEQKQRVRDALKQAEIEAMLATPISIEVSNASVEDVVNAVRKAGFRFPIEIRQPHPVSFSLTVKDVTVQSVLKATALFARSDFFVLDDHLLITAPGQLTPAELVWLQHPQNVPVPATQSFQIVPNSNDASTNARPTAARPSNPRAERIKLLSQSVIDEMQQLGRNSVHLGELSVLTQQVIQQLNNGTGMAPVSRPQLSPDTRITYETQTGSDGDTPISVLKIVNASQNRNLKVTMPR